MKNRLKTGSYTYQSLWIAGQSDSTVFGVVADTTTTKFANRACAVHGISLPVVVDKVVVVVLKFPIIGDDWDDQENPDYHVETRLEAHKVGLKT